MSAEGWTALLVATAGVVAGLAAIPATSYRNVVLLAAAARRGRSVQPAFTIVGPKPDQGVDGRGLVVSGTVADLDSDTLWVFEEGVIEDRRVWLFGGEALVDGRRWNFDCEPKVETSARPRRTLTIVRVDRNCARQLRSIRRRRAPKNRL